MCKAKKEIADGVLVTMKNGRKATQGKCPDCGTGMFRIMKNTPAPEGIAPLPDAQGGNGQ